MTSAEQKLFVETIAKQLFENGDNCNDKCQRIQFMGGVQPNNETNNGGLSKSSFEVWLGWSVAAYFDND